MDDLIKDFLSEANESIETLDRALVRFEREPEDPELLSEIFRVMHTIKGTCGFLGLPRLAGIAHASENVLGQFRDGSLKPTQDSVSAILDSVDLIKQLLVDLEASGAEAPGDDSALVRRLKEVAQAGDHGAAASPVIDPLKDRIGGLSSLDCAVESALAKARASPAGIKLHGIQEEALHAAIRDAVWSGIEGSGEKSLASTLATFGLADEAALVIACLSDGLRELGIDSGSIDEVLKIIGIRPAPVTADAAPPALAGQAGPSAVASQTIRVQVESLEQLMNVASELVLIRNQLLQTLRAQPESPFAGPLQRLNHVTTELQESVMTTRMQPIGAAFAKLPRLVRDLAIELGKRIEIEMAGEETELDRQVLEQIKDPLTHMIRNAADHGLETPGERARLGKPEAGRIRLAARHEGSHIVIEVADDGRGLPTSKIRAKALAQGLIGPAEAETHSDALIHQLIFHAGFSTAAAVTGVSGRGVGMDVVRTNIERIGGTVELSSQEGVGTKFTVRIPLTLTIVSALIVDCCGQKFALPQSSVVELVGVGGGSARTIESVNNAPVLRLRDRLLPLVSLEELMRLTPTGSREGDRCILITRIGTFSFGIIVDRVFDTEEIVVKPAASALRSIPYYSGATILGDGAVIMILDPKGIASGIGSTIADGEKEAKERRVTEEVTPLLIVRGRGPALKATPLQQVSRIESVPSESIEYADGRPVLQYRGRLMPLVSIDDGVVLDRKGEQRPVIVFDDNTRAIGLVVEEIVDIVEAPLRQEFRAKAPGALGSLVVGNHVTDILDISHYWRAAALDTALATQAEPKRRALIVESSQFQRNLLHPLLVMAGFEVVVAESVAAARDMIEAGAVFDVILTDAEFAHHDLEPHAPVIGLHDHLPPDSDRFAATACRFDRDGLLSVIDFATRKQRSAA